MRQARHKWLRSFNKRRRGGNPGEGGSNRPFQASRSPRVGSGRVAPFGVRRGRAGERRGASGRSRSGAGRSLPSGGERSASRRAREQGARVLRGPRVGLPDVFGSRAPASFGMSEVRFLGVVPTGSERGRRMRREALRGSPASPLLAAEDVGAPVRVVDLDEGSSESEGGVSELHGPSSPEATRRSPREFFGARADGRRARREAATTGLRGIMIGSSGSIGWSGRGCGGSSEQLGRASVRREVLRDRATPSYGRTSTSMRERGPARRVSIRPFGT